jgi:hypothetical protein
VITGSRMSPMQPSHADFCPSWPADIRSSASTRSNQYGSSGASYGFFQARLHNVRYRTRTARPGTETETEQVRRTGSRLHFEHRDLRQAHRASACRSDPNPPVAGAHRPELPVPPRAEHQLPPPGVQPGVVAVHRRARGLMSVHNQ